MYKTALVAKQQLEEAGFVVDLQVLDWATLVQRRNKPELFDVFSTGFTFNADPALATSLQCAWPGGWCNEDKEKLLADLARETDVKKRRALIDRVQVIFYEDVGRVKLGDYFLLDVVRKDLRGFQSTPELYFWNAWPRAMRRAHLLRWRPRPPAQRTESTPRRLPSGAASQLDPSHRCSPRFSDRLLGHSLEDLIAMKTLIAALVLMLAVGPALAQEQAPRMGGVLKIAVIGEPPSLDLHTTTATITYQIMCARVRGALHVRQELHADPHARRELCRDRRGRRYTITLRKGVRFHNGKEMTSADVVASLTRWGKVATLGKTTWRNVEAIEAKDPSTVVIHLKQASSAILFGLAEYNNAAAIYPKEVVDAAGDGQVKESIGTGPFRFVEHKPDRHIKLARFKDYSARPEAPNGLGGKRVAYADEILFLPVPDVAVRLAGVETGEYHYGQQIKQDQYERIKSLPALEPRIIKPSAWSTAVLNHKDGVMTSKKIRQAFQAALDMEPIMAAGFGNKDFYRLDGAVFFPEQARGTRPRARELYNQKDKDKARRLLKEAGYSGQPLRWITTREYELMYKNALVAKQQLEAAGFVVDLQVVDWATLDQPPQQAGALGRVLHGLRLRRVPRQPRASAALVGAGGATRRRSTLLGELAARARRQEAQGALDRIQTDLLRGRGTGETRRLLHAGRQRAGSCAATSAPRS